MPIEVYKVDGFYEQGGKLGMLHGDVGVDERGNLTGFLVDSDSPASHREIRGKIVKTNGRTDLTFAVRVPSEKLLDLEYTLTRLFGNGDFSGNYQGVWMPMEKELGRPPAVELPSGENCYFVGEHKLVPREEDKRTRPAGLTLAREEPEDF